MSSSENVAKVAELFKGRRIIYVNICPSCLLLPERKKCCKNAVLLMPEKVLVCCYLGDKHEISHEKFEEKVRELKESQ